MLVENIYAIICTNGSSNISLNTSNDIDVITVLSRPLLYGTTTFLKIAPIRCTTAFHRTISMTKFKRPQDIALHNIKRFGEVPSYTDGAAKVAQLHSVV